MLVAWLAVTIGLVLLTPKSVDAFDIRGRVINGTTDTPVSEANIVVVNPSGGMLVEKEVTLIDDLGHFTIEGLHEHNPVYLLRVSHQGVNYTEIIRFDGTDPITIEVKVYDTTPLWNNIDVSIPHMMLVRSGDTLTVDKFIQITNNTSPPKTVFGEDSRFVVYLPEDKLQINGINIRSLGVPLPVSPIPTGEPGFFAIDYPIKPGATTLQLSMDLPYETSVYNYTEMMKYDIKELLIITQDPSIEVTSTTIDIGGAEDFHGFKSYPLEGLMRDEPLSLIFRGGSNAVAGATPQVLIVPNANRNAAMVAMIALVLMMTGFLITVVTRGHSSAVEAEELGQQKEELLNQLARLDDLHKTGTVSDQMYKLKRTELMNALAGIYYRTTVEKAVDSKEPQKEGAARV